MAKSGFLKIGGSSSHVRVSGSALSRASPHVLRHFSKKVLQFCQNQPSVQLPGNRTLPSLSPLPSPSCRRPSLLARARLPAHRLDICTSLTARAAEARAASGGDSGPLAEGSRSGKAPSLPAQLEIWWGELLSPEPANAAFVVLIGARFRGCCSSCSSPRRSSPPLSCTSLSPCSCSSSSSRSCDRLHRSGAPPSSSAIHSQQRSVAWLRLRLTPGVLQNRILVGGIEGQIRHLFLCFPHPGLTSF